MRYTRQPDRYSCGPVAVLNALKWSGGNATRRNLKTFCWIAKCKPPKGCWPEQLHELIRALFRHRVSGKKGRPTLKYIDWWLDQGNAIILRYFWHCKESKKRIGHYIFIPGRTKDGYTVVNNGRSSKTVSLIPREDMNRNLRMKRDKDTCCTWFIKKLK